MYLPLRRFIEVSTSLKCLLAVFDRIMGILTRPGSDCSSKSHSYPVLGRAWDTAKKQA